MNMRLGWRMHVILTSSEPRTLVTGIMLVLAPIAGLVVGVCTGFLKEKRRVDSWARWVYTLAPYPLVCFPNASALYSWGHWLLTVAPYLPKPVLYVPSLSTLHALKPWLMSALPYVAPPLAMLPRTLLLVGSIFLGQRIGESLVGVGLTGGIATGKSTVSHIFKTSGAVIVDADVIAREVVMPGRGAYNEIVKKFGPEVLNEDKTINRAKLGSIIFSDPAKRQVLNGCTHKYILWEMFAQLFYHRFIERKRLVVFDAPLLFETKILEKFCYPIVVVACSESNELNRLIQRDNLSEEDAKKRIQSQMKLHDKVEKAHLVIQNDASLDDLVLSAQATFERAAALIGASNEVDAKATYGQ